MLKSSKSLSPTGGKGQTGPAENPERPIPNSGKGTDDPKRRVMTNMFTCKNQPAKVKKQLKNGHWQISVTFGENERPMNKSQLAKISSQ